MRLKVSKSVAKFPITLNIPHTFQLKDILCCIVFPSDSHPITLLTSYLRAVSIDTPRSDLPRVRNPTQHSYFIQIVPMKTWLGFLSFLRKESFPLSGIILSDESWPMNNLYMLIFLHYLNQLYKKCICFDVHRYRKYFVTWKTALNIKQTNTISLWRNTSKEFVSWSKKIQGGRGQEHGEQDV